MTQPVNNQHDHAPKPVRDPSGGHGDAPFDPDAAVNAALNALVGTINDLSDYCISMGNMNLAMQVNGVASAESQVDMDRRLLSAAGAMQGGANFSKILAGWAAAVKAGTPATEEEFNSYLTGLGMDTGTGKSYYSEFLGAVASDPNMSQAQKDAYAKTIAGWASQCSKPGGGPDATMFGQYIANALTPNLNQASTFVTNWQSQADESKPTQLQQIQAQIEAEISSATAAWTSIIVRG